MTNVLCLLKFIVNTEGLILQKEKKRKEDNYRNECLKQTPREVRGKVGSCVREEWEERAACLEHVWGHIPGKGRAGNRNHRSEVGLGRSFQQAFVGADISYKEPSKLSTCMPRKHT